MAPTNYSIIEGGKKGTKNFLHADHLYVKNKIKGDYLYVQCVRKKPQRSFAKSPETCLEAIDEMKAAALEGKQCAQFFQDSFYVDEQNCGLFFASPEILSKVNDADVVRRLHYDGTFFSCPKPFYQVLVVIGI